MKGGKIQIFFCIFSDNHYNDGKISMLCYTFEGVGHDRGTIFVFKGAMFLFLKEKRENFHFSFCFIHPKFCTLEYFGFFFVCSSLG